MGSVMLIVPSSFVSAASLQRSVAAPSPLLAEGASSGTGDVARHRRSCLASRWALRRCHDW